MSRLPPIPHPLECVLFDAGDTLLAPAPSFQGRFVAVASAHGLPLEEAAVDAAVADAVREAAWPSDWTDPATQRDFWTGFYSDVLTGLGHTGDGQLAEALFRAFSDPAAYRLFDDVRPALDELAARGLKLGVVSNFEPWLEEVLALQGIADRFAAVAISGTIGFVGLVVPHLLRLATGPDHRLLLPASILYGAALLALADLGARLAGGIPVGIVTALLGAPFFIWLLRRSRDLSRAASG